MYWKLIDYFEKKLSMIKLKVKNFNKVNLKKCESQFVKCAFKSWYGERHCTSFYLVFPSSGNCLDTILRHDFGIRFASLSHTKIFIETKMARSVRGWQGKVDVKGGGGWGFGKAEDKLKFYIYYVWCLKLWFIIYFGTSGH